MVDTVEKMEECKDTLSSIDAKRILFVSNRDVLSRESMNIEVWDWEIVKTLLE